jgi:hypothetical protein
MCEPAVRHSRPTVHGSRLSSRPSGRARRPHRGMMASRGAEGPARRAERLLTSRRCVGSVHLCTPGHPCGAHRTTRSAPRHCRLPKVTGVSRGRAAHAAHCDSLPRLARECRLLALAGRPRAAVEPPCSRAVARRGGAASCRAEARPGAPARAHGAREPCAEGIAGSRSLLCAAASQRPQPPQLRQATPPATRPRRGCVPRRHFVRHLSRPRLALTSPRTSTRSPLRAAPPPPPTHQIARPHARPTAAPHGDSRRC